MMSAEQQWFLACELNAEPNTGISVIELIREQNPETARASKIWEVRVRRP